MGSSQNALNIGEAPAALHLHFLMTLHWGESVCVCVLMCQSAWEILSEFFAAKKKPKMTAITINFNT